MVQIQRKFRWINFIQPLDKVTIVLYNNVCTHHGLEWGLRQMNKLLSCEFNVDSGCVELKFCDSSMIAINCTAVENEVADNMYQRSELDYLIYNDPPAILT